MGKSVSAGGSGAQPAAPTGAAPASEEKPAPSTAEGAAEASDSAGEMHNRMLGEFRILRCLGRGGMAEVYLAEQTSLSRNVAIKVLRKEFVTDETYLKRFKTEALAAAALTHPNIVQVFMVGEHEGVQFITQEYVQGMNLRELIVRKGPPEVHVAVHFMKQVAMALHAAHKAGIVHRDIKPENILITRKGDVKVADFGLAQLTQRGERLNLTQIGMTMGSPLYMSPEQVNGSKLDQRSDIYSFGVTCYHMLAGGPPFRGETALAVAVQHVKQEPEPLERKRTDLPPVLCRIVHKMMAKNPDERYQTAQAVLKDLKRISQDIPEPGAESEAEMPMLPGSPEAPARPLPVRMATAVWRAADRPLGGPLWFMLTAALLVGGASAALGWIMREPNPLEAPVSATSTVPDKGSAAKQYFYALSQKEDIPAWQAVIDRYPTDPVYAMYAKQQLARLYLARGRYDDAEPIFIEFAGRGNTEPQWRAFGLAGQAILLHLRGDFRGSQQVLDQLKPLYDSKTLYDRLDPRMQSLVNDAVRRNLESIGKKVEADWEALIKKQDSGE